ncbi:pilus assembly protein [Serratia fonticola]|uniref:fimbrial protein n=1 Tax=Serratia fonticola TaxID=47917 RepID=UPI0009BDD3B7|nr:fimbrial protein [Serratia fonticola]MBC3248940.1 fimbrial protein [Serratia fonticola]QCR62973.1 pilus assembly protein [Serratia fonticola]
MKKRWLAKGGIIACVISFTIVAQAQDEKLVGQIAFSGTLIEPPSCKINDRGLVDVDFSDNVSIKSIDGSNYRKAMNYQITCEESAIGNWALKLTLVGHIAEFDGYTALRTDKDNLAIQIYQNDQPFVPGSSLAITLHNRPELEAVLVKKIGTVLTEGKFEAWATLKAEYQ